MKTEKRTFKTKFEDMVELTRDVQEIVTESGVQTGVCIVHTTHTTAGLLITSFWDPKGHEDMQEEISRIVPTRVDFKHQDSPHDASGHIKSSIIGPTLTLIVEDGKLLLGHSQGIFFAEFDGPRKREYFVKVFSTE